MSLKSFHIFFIAISTILCFWMGFWIIEDFFFLAIFSLIIGAGLCSYGFSVFKKLRLLN